MDGLGAIMGVYQRDGAENAAPATTIWLSLMLRTNCRAARCAVSAGRSTHTISSIACPSVDPTTTMVLSSTTLIGGNNDGAVVGLSKVPRNFCDPTDGRTRDIMVQPKAEVTYTTNRRRLRGGRSGAAA